MSLGIRAHLWYGTIFLFLEQIAPSWRHISARIHAHVGGSAWMLSRCLIKWWELRDSLAYFSLRWQGIRQGLRTRALACSFMLWANGKSEFFKIESKTSILRFEWIIRSALASCKLTRTLLRLFWRTNIAKNSLLWYRVNLWVAQTMLKVTSHLRRCPSGKKSYARQFQ